MQQDINELVGVDEKSGLLAGRAVHQYKLLVGLLVIVCLSVFMVYLPALSDQALCFDDDQYLVNNDLVKNPSFNSAWRFLSEVFEPSTIGGYYQPLTMISLMLDYAIGGRPENLTVFHLTSVLIHVANTALIIMLLYLLFGKPVVAAGVGLLFGVHPLTVEPIPWTGERKTLLAAFFALCCLVFYVRYALKSRRWTYIGCIVMYILALMSKPTSTPLPVAMLLMDFWPLRRLNKWRTVTEKLPMFLAGGVFSIITFISQSTTGGITTPKQYGALRIPFVFCHNIIFYLYKMIWPVDLSPHYAFPKDIGLSNPVILMGVVGTCLLIPALVISLIWVRAALTGWLIFFVMVLPTMQVMQFSNVIASDKFVYLPSVGLLMVLAWLLGLIWGKAGGLRVALVVSVVVLLAGAETIATRRQLSYWQDTIKLYTHMIDVTPNAAPLHNNLGMAYAERGDTARAQEQFEMVIKLDPNNEQTTLVFNVGRVFEEQGMKDKALACYWEALKRWPGNPMIYSSIGKLLTSKGDYEEAATVYREGINYRFNVWQLHAGLASTLTEMGRLQQAVVEYQIAVKLVPNSELYNNLAVLLAVQGNAEEAMQNYKEAIRYAPSNAEARYNLGNLLRSMGKPQEAAVEYEKAIKVTPNYTKAYGNLAVTLIQMGKFDEAIENFRRATECEPNNLQMRLNLSNALTEKGLIDEAIAEYERILKMDPNNSEAMLGAQKARDMQTAGKKKQ